MRKALLLISAASMLMLPLGAQGEKRVFEYVNSPWEYYWHMVGHRTRVAEMAKRLPALAPELLPDVDAAILSEFVLFSHDESKLNTSKGFLKEHSYDPKQHRIASRLFYSCYGKGSASKAEHQPLKVSTCEKLRRELNRIDDEVAEKFFHERGISKEVARQYLLAERAADSLDRSLDPVAQEEFGRKVGIPCSQYWKEANPLIADLCTRAEPYWNEVWEKNSYERFRSEGARFRAKAPARLKLPRGCVAREVRERFGFDPGRSF